MARIGELGAHVRLLFGGEGMAINQHVGDRNQRGCNWIRGIFRTPTNRYTVIRLVYEF